MKTHDVCLDHSFSYDPQDPSFSYAIPKIGEKLVQDCPSQKKRRVYIAHFVDESRLQHIIVDYSRF